MKRASALVAIFFSLLIPAGAFAANGASGGAGASDYNPSNVPACGQTGQASNAEGFSCAEDAPASTYGYSWD